MGRLMTHFYRALLVLSAVCMVSALLAVVLGVLDRQIPGGLGIRGLDAYAGYAIAGCLFLALPETLRRGDHIRVTLLLERLPRPLAKALEYWGLLAALGLSAYLSWYAARLVWLSWDLKDVSQGADATPLWIPQLMMMVGCMGLAVAFAHALLARLAGKTFFDTASGEAARVE